VTYKGRPHDVTSLRQAFGPVVIEPVEASGENGERRDELDFE
jgi:hypothetical protein